ncbi:hypothetical protein CMK11_13695 [Candidatus Poribacteria bacterium]|nr:hypothetical protein [Candidatus Poribacteria bacterium]
MHMYTRRPSTSALLILLALGIPLRAAAQTLMDTVIVFSSDRDGDYEIYSVRPDNTDLRQLTTNEFDDDAPEVSPDGARIAFHSNRSGDYEVWAMDLDGSNAVNLSQNAAADKFPAWSPDGSRVAFMSTRDGSENIWVMGSVSGDSPTGVTATAAPVRNSHPDWSLTGEIAFDSDRANQGWLSIWGAAEDASVWSVLPQLVSDEESMYAAWSADGSALAYKSQTPNPIALRSVSIVDGVAGTPISVVDGNVNLCDWSPDGTKIVYSSSGGDIYVVDADGQNATLLEPGTAQTSERSPSWSPYLIAPPPSVTIAVPTADEALAAGTTSTPLAVVITDNAAPGHWHWQLDTPFADTGVAGGNHVDPGVSAHAITGLVDGGAYTVYVALVTDAAHALVDATTNANSRAGVAFTVDTPPAPYAVTVGDAQGNAGQVVRASIEVYDLTSGLYEVSGVFLSLLYDPTLLTPTDDGAGNVTAASVGPIVPAAGWTIEQNVPSPGTINVSLAGNLEAPITNGGVLLNVDFSVDADATRGQTSSLTLVTVELNEGQAPSTPVSGLFTVLNLLYGDVTGNGKAGAYDAAWVLQFVVDYATGSTRQFPVETQTPAWAGQPLPPEDAWEVADVDDSGAPQAEPADIMAIDASLILQHEVGLITAFAAETAGAAAPRLLALTGSYGLSGDATSSRPSARFTVTLDASAVADLRACELVLDFDRSLLKPVDVSLRHAMSGDGTRRALLVHRAGDGQVSVAFAAARPIEDADAILDITFKASQDIWKVRESAIRASHLRLNGSRIETDFAFPFRIEPFANRLMANYPNPFNPETWIPFELADAADVTIRIYGLGGDLVRRLELGSRPIGEHVGREDAAYWDGKNARGEAVASGVYAYELAAGDYHAVRRMVVMK